MSPKQTTPMTIDEYIAGFPERAQKVLQKIRATIQRAAPDADETISYKMPTFKLNGHYLIYFAAHKKHVGMYPIPTGDADFLEAIAPYQAGKGTLQFPLDEPIPYRLIAKVVKLRIMEELERTAKGKKK